MSLPPTTVRRRARTGGPRAARAAALALAAGLVLTGCGGGGTATTADPAAATGGPGAAAASSTPAQVQLVDGAQALALVAEGVTLVDVRTPEEFAAGHVDGAVNVDLQGDGFVDRVREVAAPDGYVVYCASGNRSAQATSLTAEAGLAPLYDAGGFDSLVQAGAEVSTG